MLTSPLISDIIDTMMVNMRHRKISTHAMEEDMATRPQLTVKQLIEFLSKQPEDTLVSVAPSVVNPDEPDEAGSEFIFENESIPVVALSYSETFGFVVGFKDKGLTGFEVVISNDQTKGG